MGTNNGSAFAGLSANVPFYNTTGGFAMLIARYWLAIPTLAIAGALVAKKRVPASAGTLPTHTPLFIGWLIGVVIIVGALIAAATLSHRYISDRFLPDKAIDLIDEAAARIKMEIDSKPESMDRLDRRLIQLKIEREAVKKESDEASKKRLGLIEEEIVKIELELDQLAAGKGNGTLALLDAATLRSLKKRINQFKEEITRFETRVSPTAQQA